MARGGGYYLRLNKNNRGYLISVGLLSHHEKNYVKPTHTGDERQF